ncbi:uncharacterized protein LOC121575712 [Coregonus clupeaformis]|uniref:uncharacterized protein LOC121575712 n=1 Tax=Coregonus clupeaformis TaxID=59861 RepID=UPI001E1C9189|nr:uncharacterized protein LOC121575712 [Coregonus clupeaformis]
MFNRSYTDPEDAQHSNEEEEDAPVNCQNTKEQHPVREEKRQDIGELKPGPSGACEKSFKRKREIHEPAAILMKKSIVQANHWMKCLHREPPKDSRHSGKDTNHKPLSNEYAKKTGVGYKWSEKQKKWPNEIEGSSPNASSPHSNHPGSSQNASPPHSNHPSSSQNASPPHSNHPGSSQNASHHSGSSQNVSPPRGHYSSSSLLRRVEPTARHHSSPMNE